MNADTLTGDTGNDLIDGGDGNDSLIGGVVDAKYTGYDLVKQWTSYGWNVFTIKNGNDYKQVVAALKTMEEWDPADRRPHLRGGRAPSSAQTGERSGVAPETDSRFHDRLQAHASVQRLVAHP